MASPREHHEDELEQDRVRSNNDNVTLPPPFFNGLDAAIPSRSSGVKFIGSSVVLLPSIELTPAGPEISGHAAEQTSTIYAVQEFNLSYLPTRIGYAAIGGLRILLLEDKNVDEDEYWDDSSTYNQDGMPGQVRVLDEWKVIAEIWVSS